MRKAIQCFPSIVVLGVVAILGATWVEAGQTQAPALPGAQPISSRDRVYTGDQTSNTVSVIDPSTNALLGAIALGNARPDEVLGPLYNKALNVHGLGFSPDGTMLAVVSITSNGVTLIRTSTNEVIGTVYLRRAPHEAFFTPDGREVWVAVRGESHIAIIDVRSMREVDRIQTMDGPSMVPSAPTAAPRTSTAPGLPSSILSIRAAGRLSSALPIWSVPSRRLWLCPPTGLKSGSRTKTSARSPSWMREAHGS